MFFLEQLINLFHVNHGGGQQGRHADKGSRMLFQGFFKFLSLYIHSQINHLVSVSFHHHGYQVLADIMQVSFHGADDDRSLTLHASVLKELLEMIHRRSHCLGTHQHLGNKHLIGLEFHSDTFHSDNQTFLKNI